MLGLAPSLKSIWKKHMEAALEEDGVFDWTRQSLPNKKIRAEVVAKSAAIFVGESLASACIEFSEYSGFSIQPKKKDGDSIKKGDVCFEWRGEAKDVLRLERPFLNLLSYASGIATAASQIKKRLPKKKDSPRITITRKILPAYRDLAIYAAQLGGVFAHRVGLSGGVLIKENHIQAAGGVAKSICFAKKAAPHTVKIEIEVKSLFELEEALKEGVDVVMLDNFKPSQVRSAIRIVKDFSPNVLVEVSGGISVENIKKYALFGVDVISVGYLTHSVQATDFSLLIR